MMRPTHEAAAAASWLTLATVLALVGARPGAVAVWGGAIIAWKVSPWPDVDNPRSSVGRRRPGTSRVLDRVAGHRTVTHWISTMAAGSALVGVPLARAVPFLWFVGAAVFVGLVSHTLLDCLTWNGSPLWGPFDSRPVRPRYGRRVECGGEAETMILRPLARGWLALAAITAALTTTIHPS